MVAVWIPLLMPLLAVPAARRLAAWLPPRAAAWLLAGCAAALAACATAALGVLAAAGALRLPAVAALGHLVLPLPGTDPDVTVPVGCAAGALLAGCALVAGRRALAHRADLRTARRAVAAHAAAGDLCVLPDAGPDAFALPGRPGRPGRIVVTAGMLRALAPAEREALFAHERAHLAGRHHLFLLTATLAAACHPLLRGLRAPLAYALERWADECAAAEVGDRALTARAIGRAALASRPGAHRPGVALAATAGPVPRRVAALLTPGRPPARPRRAGRRLVGAALLCCVAFSAAAALDAAADLHQSVEAAQAQKRW